MTDRRTWKWLRCLILVCILLTISIAIYALEAEEWSLCMGVEILTPEAMASLDNGFVEVTEELLFYGQPAAVDTETRTVYIPQEIQTDTQYQELEGQLKLASKEHSLYFAPDEKWLALYSAVQEGHRFRLLVADNRQQYTEYNVVFTTLPILKLEGEIVGQNEEARDMWHGEMCLWTPNDPEVAIYTVKQSQLQWHVRGSSTEKYWKKSWKLSLKTEDGTNRDMAFLGLGSDDDWILNSLIVDDTKIKEPLFLSMWNALAETTDYNYKGSSGDYVEVILNGNYQGLYFLQRRVDDKYLSLDHDDILLKGTTYGVRTPQEAYTIITSPLGDEETYAMMEGSFSGEDCSTICIENLIDINLFFQFAASHDNFGTKNNYYLMECEDGKYRQILIPWDTDRTFGVFAQKGPAYMYDYSVSAVYSRQEVEYIKRTYPEIETQMANRWEELRESHITENTVNTWVDCFENKINNSGAYMRDIERWGTLFGGPDTIEALRMFVKERIQVLDEYYSTISKRVAVAHIVMYKAIRVGKA